MSCAVHIPPCDPLTSRGLTRSYSSLPHAQVRTAIVIKTYTAIIRNYSSMSPEQQEREMVQVRAARRKLSPFACAFEALFPFACAFEGLLVQGQWSLDFNSGLWGLSSTCSCDRRLNCRECRDLLRLDLCGRCFGASCLASSVGLQ